MSLGGRGVVVTRPRDLSQAFALRIEAAGGRGIVFPALEIEPLAPPEALRRLAEYDVVIFVSPTAVTIAAPHAAGFGETRLAAIGSGTRQALERRSGRQVLAPGAGGDSEALLALPELANMAGQRVLIVRGEGGRALLGDTLASRGAQVDYAECYRRTLPLADAAPLLAQWSRGEVHAVTLFSADSAANFMRLVGDAGVHLLHETPVFVPHERVARAATQQGARNTIVAGTSDAEMVERLVAYFSR
jgi:uroporphyrinogen-III synthase